LVLCTGGARIYRISLKRAVPLLIPVPSPHDANSHAPDRRRIQPAGRTTQRSRLNTQPSPPTFSKTFIMSTPDSRKRQRSTSSDLSSHASSPKRAASDETSNLPLPSDKDADASMLVEGQQGLSLNDPSPSPSPHTPPSAAHLATIDQLKKSPLKENDIWYLVSKIWYNRWENACRGVLSKEGPSTHAGPVDNSDIVSSNGKLNPGVMDGVTVELVPNAVWQKLVEWWVLMFHDFHNLLIDYAYTFRYGTPTFPLPRKVVSIGTIDSLRVEFYPPIYYVHFVTSNDSSAGPGTIELPSNATCSNLLFRIMTMRESGFPRLARHTRLWQLELPSEVEITTITPEIFEASKPGLILQSSPPAAALKRTLESHWMHDGDHILVESTDDADHWIFQDPNATASIVAPLPAPPSTPPPLFQTGSDFFSRSQFSSSSKTENGTPPGSNLNAKLAAAKGKAAQDRVPGTVGLVNL
jgi:ubiquitin carboxyl-terminal hydrolase 4/11/15